MIGIPVLGAKSVDPDQKRSLWLLSRSTLFVMFFFLHGVHELNLVMLNK